MKKKKRKRNTIIIVISLIAIGASAYGIKYWLSYQAYVKAVKEIKIQEVDLSSLEDGEYVGEYDVNFISAKVKVTIKNHKINNIDYVYHKNDRGEKATVISDHIVEEQKIKVDTISGATNSSKVIQKAVEIALLGK